MAICVISKEFYVQSNSYLVHSAYYLSVMNPCYEHTHDLLHTSNVHISYKNVKTDIHLRKKKIGSQSTLRTSPPPQCYCPFSAFSPSMFYRQVCCQLPYQDFSADWRKSCVVQILISKSTIGTAHKWSLRKPPLHKVFFGNLLENPPKIPLFFC